MHHTCVEKIIYIYFIFRYLTKSVRETLLQVFIFEFFHNKFSNIFFRFIFQTDFFLNMHHSDTWNFKTFFFASLLANFNIIISQFIAFFEID